MLGGLGVFSFPIRGAVGVDDFGKSRLFAARVLSRKCAIVKLSAAPCGGKGGRECS